MLLAFEVNGWDGIPISESTDHGSSWRFVANARDPAVTDRPRCGMLWQPHLTELPRTQHGIAAGTVLLSASTVCQQPPPGRGAEKMYLRLFTSRDLGRSRSYVSTYAEAAGEAPVWEPNLQILDDGTFVEFYSDETHKNDGYNPMCRANLTRRTDQSGGILMDLSAIVASPVLSSPLSSRGRRSLPPRRRSTPSARRRSATWRLRRGSPRR